MGVGSTGSRFTKYRLLVKHYVKLNEATVKRTNQQLLPLTIENRSPTQNALYVLIESASLSLSQPVHLSAFASLLQENLRSNQKSLLISRFVLDPIVLSSVSAYLRCSFEYVHYISQRGILLSYINLVCSIITLERDKHWQHC